MRPDIDWKGIAHCWETLVKENQKQAEVLRILKKFGYFACEVHENNETKRHLHVCKNGEFATLELTEGEFETITKWIAKNNLDKWLSKTGKLNKKYKNGKNTEEK